uniref:Glutaredoxin-like protein n=1 Tax=Paramormyrops kingsleyae TaxID=1676925 RepID=A0A3B3SXZ8_9TELE
MRWLTHKHLQQIAYFRPFFLRMRSCSQKPLPVLTLFTKFLLQEVDITLPENSMWLDRYKFDIPVFHLNGQFLMMHRVNTAILEKRLEKIEKTLQSGIE